MGVRTTADEKIDDLVQLVQQTTEASFKAYYDICVVGDMWGSDEFNAEFRAKLKKVTELMLEAKELMK